LLPIVNLVQRYVFTELQVYTVYCFEKIGGMRQTEKVTYGRTGATTKLYA